MSARFPSLNIWWGLRSVPVWSITSPFLVPEGDADTTDVPFTISVEGLSGRATIRIRLSGAGANPVNEADVVGGFRSELVTFNGSGSRNFVAQVWGDTDIEPSEVLRGALSEPSLGIIAVAFSDTIIGGDDYDPSAPVSFDATLGPGFDSTTAFDFSEA